MPRDRVQIEFERLFEQVFTMDRASVDVALDVDDRMTDAIVIASKANEINICGRGTNELLCGIYSFFEGCGMLFSITGESFIPKARLMEIPEIHQTINPSVKNRGIRMHLNFVQDQSFFSEEDF